MCILVGRQMDYRAAIHVYLELSPVKADSQQTRATPPHVSIPGQTARLLLMMLLTAKKIVVRQRH